MEAATATEMSLTRKRSARESVVPWVSPSTAVETSPCHFVHVSCRSTQAGNVWVGFSSLLHSDAWFIHKPL